MTDLIHAPDWLADRIAEARAIIADAAHHSDRLVIIACEAGLPWRDRGGARRGKAAAPDRRCSDGRSAASGMTVIMIFVGCSDETPRHPRSRSAASRGPQPAPDPALASPSSITAQMR